MDRPDDLNALERRLGNLRPAPLAIDRDRMMYLAGQAAVRTGVPERLSSVALVAITLAAIGLGAGLWNERSGRRAAEFQVAELRAQRPQAVEIVVATTSPTPREASSYLVLTRRALEGDLDLRVPNPGARVDPSVHHESGRSLRAGDLRGLTDF